MHMHLGLPNHFCFAVSAYCGIKKKTQLAFYKEPRHPKMAKLALFSIRFTLFLEPQRKQERGLFFLAFGHLPLPSNHAPQDPRPKRGQRGG